MSQSTKSTTCSLVNTPKREYSPKESRLLTASKKSSEAKIAKIKQLEYHLAKKDKEMQAHKAEFDREIQAKIVANQDLLQSNEKLKNDNESLRKSNDELNKDLEKQKQAYSRLLAVYFETEKQRNDLQQQIPRKEHNENYKKRPASDDFEVSPNKRRRNL